MRGSTVIISILCRRSVNSFAVTCFESKSPISSSFQADIAFQCPERSGKWQQRFGKLTRLAEKDGGSLGDVNRVTIAWSLTALCFVRKTSWKENTLGHCLFPSSLRQGELGATNKKRLHCAAEPVSVQPYAVD